MPKTTFNIKVELEDGHYCKGCWCLYEDELGYENCSKYGYICSNNLRLSECIEEHGGGE